MVCWLGVSQFLHNSYLGGAIDTFVSKGPEDKALDGGLSEEVGHGSSVVASYLVSDAFTGVIMDV